MSFVKAIEEVIDELSDWAVETVLKLLDEIMPDGKPFFKEPMTIEEELEEYYGVRGDPEAWTKWMAQQTVDIILELQDSAVPPDMILSVHPADIAQKTAVEWSANMEQEIEKRNGRGLLGTGGTMETASAEVLPAGTSGQGALSY